MRFHGERIDKAEEYLENRVKQKMDFYRDSKDREIANGLLAYESEHNETSEYEFMKLNHWDTWRSLVIGILDYDGKKVSHTHTVEIEESMNPKYFSECMMRYAPWQALSNDKPF